MDPAALIARLSALSGPSAELNGQIWWALDRRAAERCYWNAAMGKPHPLGDEMPEGLGRLAVRNNAPHYTGPGIDAAMGLVPAGQDWKVEHVSMEGYRHPFGAAVFLPETARRMPGVRVHGAPTPAIALLIAILRAKETER